LGDVSKAALIKGGLDFASGAAKSYAEGEGQNERADAERAARVVTPSGVAPTGPVFTKPGDQAMSYRNFFKPLEPKPIKQNQPVAAQPVGMLGAPA
jgi:hypothetical protein